MNLSQLVNIEVCESDLMTGYSSYWVQNSGQGTADD